MDRKYEKNVNFCFSNFENDWKVFFYKVYPGALSVK